MLTDPATWRDLAWLSAHYLAGIIGLAGLALLPLGAFGLLTPGMPPQRTTSGAS